MEIHVTGPSQIPRVPLSWAQTQAAAVDKSPNHGLPHEPLQVGRCPCAKSLDAAKPTARGAGPGRHHVPLCPSRSPDLLRFRRKTKTEALLSLYLPARRLSLLPMLVFCFNVSMAPLTFPSGTSSTSRPRKYALFPKAATSAGKKLNPPSPHASVAGGWTCTTFWLWLSTARSCTTPPCPRC